MRRFEYKDAKSSKFWEMEVKGKTLHVTFGRIGTEGESKSKSFANPEKAISEMERLIKQKTAKGYLETNPSNGSIKEKARRSPSPPNKISSKTGKPETSKRKPNDQGVDEKVEFFKLENAFIAGDFKEIINLRLMGAKCHDDYHQWRAAESATEEHIPYSRQVMVDDCPLAINLDKVLKVVGPIYGGASFSFGDRPAGWARAAAENRILSLSDHGYVMVGDQNIDVYSRFITTRPVPVPWNTILIGETGNLKELENLSDIPENLKLPAWDKYKIDPENPSDEGILELALHFFEARINLNLTKDFANFREINELFIDILLEKPSLQENNLILVLKYLSNSTQDPKKLFFKKAMKNGLNTLHEIIWKILFWRREVVYSENLDENFARKWLKELESTNFEKQGKNSKLLGDLTRNFTKVLLGEEQPSLEFLSNLHKEMDISKVSLELIMLKIISSNYCLHVYNSLEEIRAKLIIEMIPFGISSILTNQDFLALFLELQEQSDLTCFKKLIQMGFWTSGRFHGRYLVPVASMVNSLIHSDEDDQAKAKKMKMLELLLVHGANPYEMSHFGINAINLAKQENTVFGKSVLKLLEKYESSTKSFPGLVMLPVV